MKTTESADSKKKVGGSIDSWCGKCKMVLAHTIEAMVGEKPARVHCNTCKSQHAYRPGAPVTKTPRKTGDGVTAEKAPRQPAKPRATKYQSLLNARSSNVPRT